VIAGLIGFTSSSARGSIGIYFTQEVYLKLIERMFGESFKKIDRQNEDAAAEMMNIIFGCAKVTLNEQGHGIKLSIPSVLRGNNIKAKDSKTNEVIVTVFKTDLGDFFLEFALVPFKETEKIKSSTRVFDNATKAAFFKPFVDSTITTLKAMASVTANPGTPSTKKNSDAFSFDLAGIIGITSDGISGSYMLSFKQDVFLKVMSRMLGEEFTQLQPGMEDGVAELLNIILGAAKVILNDQQGHSIQMALPSLLQGDLLKSNVQVGKMTIVIPFYSDVGRFVVEVTVD
jgi:CheY-specific phosphatase CheX